ncbi:ERCC4 domain [Macleaya cordata]|uniref:Crossover junction endonuclease MUS81 n=1 Tax=Macleaya cordata TaxID=56857 RepID=A0A200QML5_MACCD|nr:ERCC4 domain [Macleaya cordata]
MDNWNQKQVLCPENEELALFMRKKRQEMAEPKGISERIDATLYKAYSNVCNTKTPIKTLKEFSQIKGVGKWILKHSQEFFETYSGTSEPEGLSQKGKKTKGTRRYLPQKNSVAYALLITLYRGTLNGSEYMRKQELIDAAEASGLSRVPIMPEKGKGKPTQFGSSAREWYSGWSCMKTLITRGLVAKSSCPAKYMLTQEGLEAARECLSRCGSVDCNENLATSGKVSSQDVVNASDLEFACTNLSDEEVTLLSNDSSFREKSVDVPVEFLERFTEMGYSKEDIQIAFAKVSQVTKNKDTSSLRSAILHHLRKVQVDALLSECRQTIGKGSLASSSTCVVEDVGMFFFIKSLNSEGLDANMNALMMPPLKFGERFMDVYDVILILDDREHFAKNNKGSRSRKIIENISSEFKIQVEVRRLPVGDGIWIARDKHLENEFVLDFIVERKEVDDFRQSIRDNRYKDQKLRLLRCGIKKLIYLVEGDPNFSEAAETIKTACFTTEILEGFDVQRTSGLLDTLRKYGYLTQAIIHYYREKVCNDKIKHNGICPSFDEFIKKCEDLEKITVSDVFAVQLMQVPQVTEEIALAVLDLYPTLLLLARAYSVLEGDVQAQEEMLKKQGNNLISGPASRNIFQLVWGG